MLESGGVIISAVFNMLLLFIFLFSIEGQLCGELILARHARPPNFVTPQPTFSRPHSMLNSILVVKLNEDEKTWAEV